MFVGCSLEKLFQLRCIIGFVQSIGIVGNVGVVGIDIGIIGVLISLIVGIDIVIVGTRQTVHCGVLLRNGSEPRCIIRCCVPFVPSSLNNNLSTIPFYHHQHPSTCNYYRPSLKSWSLLICVQLFSIVH